MNELLYIKRRAKVALDLEPIVDLVFFSEYISVGRTENPLYLSSFSLLKWWHKIILFLVVVLRLVLRPT